MRIKRKALIKKKQKNTSRSTWFASSCHSRVFRSNSSGTHVAFPTMRMVPATSHSSSHRPGVVGLGVVVVVDVDDVLEISLVLGITDIFIDVTVAVRAASNSFSMEIGVVDGVGHPVNSVVALKFH